MKIMIGLLVATMAGAARQPEIAAKQQTAAPPSSVDWMSEEEGVLELRLAHDEKERPDGGTLRIDSNKRTVVWEGIPGEFGCKLKVEASFDDVDGISTGEEAGFVLAFKRGKNRKLVLIPVPHAWWFKQQWTTQDANVGKVIPEGTLRDHDGSPMSVTGAAGGVGPRLKRREIPKDAVAATRKAANAVRAALGRELLR